MQNSRIGFLKSVDFTVITADYEAFC